MKEIICLNEDCKSNKHGHCIYPKDYIMITQEGLCKDFEEIDRTPENINNKLSEDKQTEIYLKELTQRQ